MLCLYKKVREPVWEDEPGKKKPIVFAKDSTSSSHQYRSLLIVMLLGAFPLHCSANQRCIDYVHCMKLRWSIQSTAYFISNSSNNFTLICVPTTSNRTHTQHKFTFYFDTQSHSVLTIPHRFKPSVSQQLKNNWMYYQFGWNVYIVHLFTLWRPFGSIWSNQCICFL